MKTWTLYRRLFIHKLMHWEYWPTWIIYLPCFLVYPYYALKARYTLFFTVANPRIKFSGAFLSSKKEIYSLLPEQLIPQTIYIDETTSPSTCTKLINSAGLYFPVIVKPDLGLRGLGIKLINSRQALLDFVEANESSYLIQEFVPYDNEIGIFVIRDLENDIFNISSIVEREFMRLVGNGKSTIKELMLSIPRYAMQLDWINEQDRILPSGESLVLPKIGNHSRGTIFRDANQLNCERLRVVVNKILEDTEGFNYGRLDIKYDNWEEFMSYNNFKIIELNGVYSEPAHIYDPDYKLIKAWNVLLSHFKYLFIHSSVNILKGHKPLTFFQGIIKIFQHFKITSKFKA